MAQQILLVGLGGCIGSVARYLVSTWVQSRSASLFPFGTLAVNMLGCLLIGALMAWLASAGLVVRGSPDPALEADRRSPSDVDRADPEGDLRSSGGGSVRRPTTTLNLRLLLVTGVLGGFTTFSAFGYETLALAMIERQPWLALANVAAEVVLGLVAAWAGWWVASNW
ncbi:MAG: CrcB family protein [Planctomycetales bacterium]|nr:CrcB family protein [Planctomycetales bacterium]